MRTRAFCFAKMHSAENLFKRRVRKMNTLVIVLIAAVVLVAAYLLYGRWLAKNGE